MCIKEEKEQNILNKTSSFGSLGRIRLEIHSNALLSVFLKINAN